MTGCMDSSLVSRYLQIVFAALIFGVGVPAALIQALVPPEVRTVVHRHWRVRSWSAVFILIPLLSALLFLWGIRDCSSEDASDRARLFGNIAVSLSLLSVVGAWWLQTSHRREHLLARLQRKAIRSIATGSDDVSTLVDDIVELGRYSKTRSECAAVVQSLSMIGCSLVSTVGYDGAALEDVATGIEKIALDSEDQHLATLGIRGIQQIAKEIPVDQQSPAADIGRLVRVIMRFVGSYRALLGERPLRTAFGVVEGICSRIDVADAMAAGTYFGIGVRSIETGHTLTAIQALTKLQRISERHSLLDAQHACHHLGLVAHLDALGGSAAKRARVGIQALHFRPSLEACLRASATIHNGDGRFATADLLLAFADKVERESPPEVAFAR